MKKILLLLTFAYSVVANAQYSFPFCPPPPEKIEAGKLCIPKPQELPICPTTGEKGTCFEAAMSKEGLVHISQYENNELKHIRYIRAFYKDPYTVNNIPKPQVPLASPRLKNSDTKTDKDFKNTVTDIQKLCPNQVPPSMPTKAIRDNIQGTVKAEVLVIDGKVEEVNILSGARIFHSAVVSALFDYDCDKILRVGLATQEFTFRIE